jgi:hypothetical protein
MPRLSENQRNQAVGMLPAGAKVMGRCTAFWAQRHLRWTRNQ